MRAQGPIPRCRRQCPPEECHSWFGSRLAFGDKSRRILGVADLVSRLQFPEDVGGTSTIRQSAPNMSG